MEGGLLLHSLGEPADAAGGQGKHFLELLIQGFVKPGIHIPVEPVHILHGGGGEIEHVIGNIADALFQIGVIGNGLTVYGDGAAVRLVDAGKVADDGGLACAVGSHQTIHSALGHGKAEVVQRLKAAEGLGHIV